MSTIVVHDVQYENVSNDMLGGMFLASHSSGGNGFYVPEICSIRLTENPPDPPATVVQTEIFMYPESTYSLYETKYAKLFPYEESVFTKFLQTNPVTKYMATNSKYIVFSTRFTFDHLPLSTCVVSFNSFEILQGMIAYYSALKEYPESLFFLSSKNDLNTIVIPMDIYPSPKEITIEQIV